MTEDANADARPAELLREGGGGTVHEQVWLEQGSQAAWIDRGIAPLIRELWRRAILTGASCEDLHALRQRQVEPGEEVAAEHEAYIAFPSEQDAREFLHACEDFPGSETWTFMAGAKCRHAIRESP
jgi:hypothetical protein